MQLAVHNKPFTMNGLRTRRTATTLIHSLPFLINQINLNNKDKEEASFTHPFTLV